MRDWLTMGGHGGIILMLAWVLRTLHVKGYDISIRIWRNGKDKDA